MEKFLRPDKLQIDPESPTASEEWTHWLQTFEDFLTMTEFVEDKDKLKLLTNRLSFTTYKFIKESETYQDALRVLNSIYIKQKNEIFSRYLVMTRKQQQGETIDKYVSELKLLSQDCVFEAVNAIQYRDHYIRDAFINGLASSYIRQRLFENKTLDLAEAVEQSRALEMAQAQVESYPKSMYEMQTCATNELAKQACQYEFALQQKEEATVSAIKNVDGKCYFCGHDRHSRDRCPAREATCGKCNKTGHYARVCKSNPTQHFKVKLKTSSTSAALIATTHNTSVLKDSTVEAKVNGLKANCLIDTGSTSSFVNLKFVQLNKIKMYNESGQVSLAASNMKSNVHGFVEINLNLLNHNYNNFKMTVLEDLCTDVLIGHDIMKLHSNIQVWFGGKKPPLLVCSCAKVEPPKLFCNLTPDYRLESLLSLPVPKDQVSLKRVLGFFAHYSKWIHRFSDKIRNLTQVNSFPLSQEAVADFESLKLDIANSVITPRNGQEPLVVETDASDIAVAATLSQDNRPIAFFSRTLSKSEKLYSVVEKEAVAIVEALRKWKSFLIGRDFRLYTDQQALSFIFDKRHTSKIKNDKVMRWATRANTLSI
ncbi:uncharacterized protein LOC128989145 [Macrosteles quadrilineatus]|uniref:uncharacterized protein LOC128989145 n=1 Tax=Macrosteles quadrilineatus TaxID=74068 RepID=UPI0023E320CC|nr:uncharacterized protein LOC128989145 [Macrosteles quadrilineatus]